MDDCNNGWGGILAGGLGGLLLRSTALAAVAAATLSR